MDMHEPQEGWTQERIDNLRRITRETKADDLYLCAGSRPFLRTGGKLVEINEYPVVTDQVLLDYFAQFLSEAERQTWENREADVEKTIKDSDGLHVRINCYNNEQGRGVTLRVLHKVPTFTELSPQGTETLRKLSNSTRGLIIVTGQAGSGKTTTLAAFIDHINRYHCKTILTIEKPIQFFHESQASMVMQRQVGFHCPDYTAAIRSGLRSNVDIIMIDEIHTHDYETVYSAILAAESTLVLTSMRSFGGAGWTLRKLVDATPPDNRDLMVLRLSRVLQGVLWQDLVPITDSLERQPVMEIMFNSPKIATLIRKMDFASIGGEIEKTEGMVSMRKSVSSWKGRMEGTSKVIEFLTTVGEIGLMFI